MSIYFFHELNQCVDGGSRLDKSSEMKPNEARPAPILPIAALISVQVIFGFNYAASKVILEQYPPIFWGGLRVGAAAILMFLVSLFVVPKDQRRIDLEFLRKTFFYGVIGIGLNTAFFMLGLKYTTTTNAAILSSLTPIFTLLFAIIAGTEKFTKNRVFGFTLAVVGAIVIRKFEDFRITSDTFKGDIYTILNCVTLALFFILSGDFLKKNSPFWATAWMFLFGSIVLLAASIPDFHYLVPEVMTGTLAFAMFYNIILATMVTFFLNSWSLTKVNPSFVAIFIYLQPAVALINAWWNGGESPNARVVTAMCLIFTGVGIGALKKA